MTTLIPPKQALEISKTGKNMYFNKFKETFIQVYNDRVTSPGFTFPMVIYLNDIEEYDPELASNIEARHMHTMIKTIMTEHDTVGVFPVIFVIVLFVRVGTTYWFIPQDHIFTDLDYNPKYFFVVRG